MVSIDTMASVEDTFREASSFSLSRLGLSGVCLKEEQLAAVKGVYERQDVFVYLPTGYGKSRACVTKPCHF